MSQSLEFRKKRRNAVTEKPVAPATRRGVETRARLLRAAIRILNRVGYPAMRIADVTKEAGVPISLFYRYFQGKQDITLECLRLLHGEIADAIAADSIDDKFDRILASNRRVIRMHAENPGLARCIIAFSDAEPQFAAEFRQVSLSWDRVVARSIDKRAPKSSDGERLAISHALGGLVDQFLHEYYVARDPTLHAAFRDDVEMMAVFISTLWYRALYLENPPIEKLGALKAFAGMHAAQAAKPEKKTLATAKKTSSRK